MYIYKTVFDSQIEGKVELINKGVWKEVTEEGVTTMQYINGTLAVVNIGKVVDESKTTDPDNPVYYPGWAYDIMSSAVLNFGANEVYPGDKAVSQFYGWPRNTDNLVPNPPVNNEEEE